MTRSSGQMASKKIDLNALRAARREASGEGPIVEFGDPAVEFTMPTELPFVVVEAVGRLNEAGDDDEAQNRVASGMLGDIRSEERRVGKEGRSRWSTYH